MFRKFVVTPLLVLALCMSSIVGTASATVITTQQAMSAEVRAGMEQDVLTAFARDDVRQAMERLGVDPADAEGRIGALSDAELMQLQAEIDQMPAGGLLAVIGVVFVVLLILELVGVTDIFKKV
ncbi:MAG: PA2779 family protein [Luteimonas sp.]|nr:PA2779 family protein [Luteimonas sp.]